jgi:antitoxin component YwqK of YwqJK toxin-antitoxin module
MRRTSGTTVVLVTVAFLAAGCSQVGPPKNIPPSRADVAWVNGKPAGPVIVYDGWGRAEVRGTFHNGMKEGTWSYHASTGQKIVETSYRNDLKDGLCLMWYGSRIGEGRYAGNLKLEITFHKGQPKGTKRRWYPGGEKYSEVEFDNGRIAGARVWEKDGKPLPASEAMSVAEDEWRGDQKYFAVMDEVVEEGLKNSGAPPSRP